jgi:hypothetical protein
MKQNDLDKFLKGKLEEQSFDYNPADWANALELLKNKDTKRRPLWIWWSAAAGIALLLGAAYIYNFGNDASEGTEVIVQTENPTDQNSAINKETKALSQTDITSENIHNKEVQIEEALVSQVEQSTANGSDIATVQKEVIPKITSLKTGSINLPDPISGNNPKLEPISSPVSESVADVRTGEDFSLSNPIVEDDKESVSDVLSLDRSYDRESTLLLTSLIRSFTGGLSTMYRFNKVLSINADLLYSYRTGTFDKSNVSETKRYSFEALDGISTLNPTALHYASIPLYAGVHFGKHRVTLGGSFNYLGGVRGDVVDQTVGTGGTILEESSQSGWIAKDGFTTTSIGGMIGYDYFVSNRWSVSFRSNYLFKNIVDPSISEKISSFIVKENSQVNLQIGSTFYFR